MKRTTSRLVLRTLATDDVVQLLEFYRRNEGHFSQWDPVREEGFYTETAMREMIASEMEGYDSKRSVKLYLLPEHEERIIGFVGASNIVYGAFLSCFLGYKIDKDEQGKGYMLEALGDFIGFLFGEYRLHRIEANILPGNERSIRLVKKLGFMKEGSSPKYLRINGKWEDHDHYVLRNREME